MNRLMSRVDRIAEALNIAPIEIVVVSTEDPGAEEKKELAVTEYLEKYGDLGNLRIVTTHCPEPLPLPEGLRPAKQSI